MLGLWGSPLLGAPYRKPDDYFQKGLLPLRPAESNAQGKASGVSRNRIIFIRIRQDWMFFFGHQAKTVRAWLEISDSSTVFTRPCTFGFPFILSSQNSLSGEKFQFPGWLQKAPGRVLCYKRKKLGERWNCKLAWKMAEGRGTNGEYTVQPGCWWKWKTCLS